MSIRYRGKCQRKLDTRRRVKADNNTAFSLQHSHQISTLPDVTQGPDRYALAQHHKYCHPHPFLPPLTLSPSRLQTPAGGTWSNTEILIILAISTLYDSLIRLIYPRWFLVRIMLYVRTYSVESLYYLHQTCLIRQYRPPWVIQYRSIL